MTSTNGTIYSFGRFTFESAARRLLRDGQELATAGKRLAILAILLENSGKVVRKEEIFRQVWEDQIVEDANLTLHIHNLRRLLDDDPRNPVCILTVPGVGYMFIAPVTVVTLGVLITEGAEPPVDPPVDSPVAASGREAASAGDLAVRAPAWRGLIRRHWRWTLLASGLLCLAVGLLAGYLINERRVPGEPTRFIQLTTLPGIESDPRFSPDGKRVVFTSEDPLTENFDIYVKDLAGGEHLRLTSDPRHDFSPVWSSDGRKIAYLRHARYVERALQLVVTSLAGGDEQVLGTVQDGLDWSPDGQHLVVSDQAGPLKQHFLFLVSPVDGARSQLTFPVEGDFIRDSAPIFSPDGRTVAFLRKKSEDTALSEIHLIDLASRKIRQLTFARGRITNIQWNHRDNEIVYSSNRDGQRRLWRVAAAGGSPVMIGRINAEVEQISISPDGETLAYTEALLDTNIDLRPLGGDSIASRICRIASSRADDSPRFSPDGRQIVFVSNRSGWDELWAVGLDCQDPRPLTNFQELGLGSPRWSGDGTMIAYDRRGEGRPEIHLLRLADLSSRRLLVSLREDAMPAWGVADDSIYFESNRTGISQVWKVAKDGQDLRQVTLNGGREAIEADAGRLLIYTNSDYLWQKDLQTGVEVQIPEMKELPVGRYWDVVGSNIYFVSQTRGVDPVVKVFSLKSRQIRSVLTVNGYLARWVPGLAVSPDERHLAISYVHYRSGDVTLVRGWR